MKPRKSALLFPVRTASRRRQIVAISALIGLVTLPAAAQWSQNASTGPFLYTDPANWTGGTINNTFSANPTTNLNVTWDADYTLSSALSLGYTGAQNITFRSSDSTARTIKMAGSWTRGGGGTLTIGTVANPLVIDLNGATRTFGGSTSTVQIYAKITNATGTAGITLNNGTGYTHLYNNTSDFTGPVNFTRRGGSFSSIRNVGGGASSLGAPTTTANGLITVSDSTSYGNLDYAGTGDTSDRNWQWNLTGGDYEFKNTGGGTLTLNGNFTFNTTSTGFAIRANNADIDLLGVISDGGTRSINFTGGGVSTRTIALGSNNTYSGKTSISGVTLGVPSLKNAGTASSIGDATGANANIAIGSSTTAGRLRYTGTGDETDRAVELAGTTGGAAGTATGGVAASTLAGSAGLAASAGAAAG